jgi:hypothetical protein
MSDYLGNLLERSFAPVLGVRPQIASVFAPAPASGLINSSDGLDLSTESLTERPAQPGLPKKSETDEPASIPPWSQKNGLLIPFSQPPQPNHPASAEPGKEFIPTSTQGAESMVPADRISSPRSRPSAPTAGVRPEDSRQSGITPSPDREPSSRPAPAEPARSGAVVPLSQADRESPVRAARVPGRNDSRPMTQAGNQPAPTIHVTIGRVEVRAIAPAATTRTKQKKEPGMSLDAYLQRRSDGGRR